MNIGELNGFRLGFVYASLGLISPNIRCAAFAVVNGQKFKALFVLREESNLDRAAIRLICEEFEAQHPCMYTKEEGRFHIDCRVVVSQELIRLPLEGGLQPFFREFDGSTAVDGDEQDPPAWWLDANRSVD